MKIRERLICFIHSGWAKFTLFGRWWLSELVALVPLSVKRYVLTPVDIFMVDVGPDEVKVSCFGANGMTQVRHMAFADLEAVDAPVAPVNVPALVALFANDVFVDRFRIPDVAQARLRQTIEFEAERRNPFHAQDTAFDFSVVGRNAADKMLDIEWAVVPVDLVQKAQLIARKLGFFPVAAGMASARQQASLQYVFSKQKLPRSFKLTSATICLFCAAAFFLGSAGFAIISHMQEPANLARTVEAVKAEANKALDVKTRTEKTTVALSSLAAHASEPRVLDVLLEVTKALPDDTWVSSFELNGDELKISGYSASASALIERLSAVSLFDRPHFRAPIIPQADASGHGKGIEHFDISVMVRNRHKTGGA